MNKFDITVFTEQLSKCYTLINQQEIIIGNVKELMQEFNNLDISGTSEIKAMQESIKSLEDSINELKEDFNNIALPTNLKPYELVLKDGEQVYAIHATSEDGLYIYDNDNDVMQFYNNKIYANNLISSYTMPPKISYDVSNINISGNFTTSLSPIPSGETLTINLQKTTSPPNRRAFDWSTISDLKYSKSVEYLSRPVINVKVVMPTEYEGGVTLNGIGRQISNNFFPSSENVYTNKIYGTYLVNCYSNDEMYPQDSHFLTLIVVLGVNDEYNDRLEYRVMNTINYTGFIDYH